MLKIVNRFPIEKYYLTSKLIDASMHIDKRQLK